MFFVDGVNVNSINPDTGVPLLVTVTRIDSSPQRNWERQPIIQCLLQLKADPNVESIMDNLSYWKIKESNWKQEYQSMQSCIHLFLDAHVKVL